MTPPRDIRSYLATGRNLLDHWSEPDVLHHMRDHDEHMGGTPDPERCDYCYVRPMLVEIHEAYFSGAAEILYTMQDGYGIVGFVPEQGLDWSGVRDSTPATIERMWQAIHA